MYMYSTKIFCIINYTYKEFFVIKLYILYLYIIE